MKYYFFYLIFDRNIDLGGEGGKWYFVELYTFFPRYTREYWYDHVINLIQIWYSTGFRAEADALVQLSLSIGIQIRWQFLCWFAKWNITSCIKYSTTLIWGGGGQIIYCRAGYISCQGTALVDGSFCLANCISRCASRWKFLSFELH